MALGTAFAALSLAKAASDLFRPKTTDFIPRENEFLNDALRRAAARARDPRTFENSVELVSRQYAPLYQKQIENLAPFRNRPALYNRLLQEANQLFATNVSNALDKAAVLEGEQAAQADEQVAMLGAQKFQTDVAIGQALAADKQRIYDIFSDIFGAGAEITGNMLGQRFGADLERRNSFYPGQ